MCDLVENTCFCFDLCNVLIFPRHLTLQRASFVKASPYCRLQYLTDPVLFFSVDLIPMLSEKAGLPSGTPIAMFEVRVLGLFLPLYSVFFF